MNKYNQEWIDKHKPCMPAVKWAKPLLGKPIDKTIQICIEKEKYEWAEWVISKELTHKNNVRWAIFSAEQVIDIFEKEYPEDKRPRQAIEAAKKWVKKPNKENAAHAAAYAANVRDAANATTDAAICAAYAAADASYAAAHTTDAAAYATDAASCAAHAAAYAAAAAAYAAYAADAAAEAKTRKRCDEYGLKLLREQDRKPRQIGRGSPLRGLKN